MFACCKQLCHGLLILFKLIPGLDGFSGLGFVVDKKWQNPVGVHWRNCEIKDQSPVAVVSSAGFLIPTSLASVTGFFNIVGEAARANLPGNQIFQQGGWVNGLIGADDL